MRDDLQEVKRDDPPKALHINACSLKSSVLRFRNLSKVAFSHMKLLPLANLKFEFRRNCSNSRIIYNSPGKRTHAFNA